MSSRRVKKGSRGGPGPSNTVVYRFSALYRFRALEAGDGKASAAHNTLSMYVCSYGSNAQGMSNALEGRLVSTKKPFMGPRQRLGNCWEEQKSIVFLDEGSLICPPGK